MATLVETALRLLSRGVRSLYHALVIVATVTNLVELVGDRCRAAVK